jgi:hypothetical protein
VNRAPDEREVVELAAVLLGKDRVGAKDGSLAILGVASRQVVGVLKGFTNFNRVKCLRGRLHVRISVRIGVRIRIQFADHPISRTIRISAYFKFDTI